MSIIIIKMLIDEHYKAWNDTTKNLSFKSRDDPSLVVVKRRKVGRKWGRSPFNGSSGVLWAQYGVTIPL